MTADLLVPRPWALDRAAAWLADGESALFLITGSPGTGKTTFAHQLVSHLESTADVVLAHYCVASDERTLDALDFVRALSHGLARDVPGFANALASAAAGVSATVNILGRQSVGVVEAGASVTNIQISLPRDVPTRQAFMHLVRQPLEAVVESGWGGRIVVVVDDLSGGYGYDSEDNIARLLSAVASNQGVLRFIATSRPDPWVLRDLPAPDLDLRADQPAEQDDVRGYVGNRLAEQHPEWVDRVTAAADGNFLYARHVIDDLLERPALAGHELPTGLTGLYRRWLVTTVQRSRERWWERRHPVLGALTAAQGAGLTPEQLIGVTGLTGTIVRRVLEECAQFLSGELRTGPVRLYHDSFREFLAEKEVDVEEAHRAIATYFTSRHRDGWLDADPYAQAHLVTHAAETGGLPDLLTRPDYLVVAEPTAVLHALSQQGGDSPLSEIYRRVGWLLGPRAPGDRASSLELAAREIGEHGSAAEFARLRLDRTWSPLWMSLVRRRPVRLVGVHPGGVLDMVAVELPGTTAVATVGGGAVLRLWDLRTHTALATVPLPEPSVVSRLAVYDTADGPRIVAAGARHIALIDPVRAEITGSLPVTGLVTAVAAWNTDDHPVVVLGHAGGQVTAIDPESGRVLGGPVALHDGPVTALAVAYGDAVLSGGADGRVLLWPLAEDQGEVWISAGGPIWCGGLAFWILDDGSEVLAAGFSDGVLDLKVFRGGRWVGRSGQVAAPAGSSSRALRPDEDGGLSIMMASGSGTNRYDDIARSREEGSDELVTDIARLLGGVNAADMYVANGIPHVLTGGEDGRVALVLAEEGGSAQHEVQPGLQPVSSVRFASVDDRMVVLAAEFGEFGDSGLIREWPLGKHGALLPRHTGDLVSKVVDVDTLGELTALALEDGAVLLRDGTGQTRHIGDADLAISGVRLWQRGNQLAVIAYGYSDGAALRLWETDTLAAHDFRFEGQTEVSSTLPLGDRLLIGCSGDTENPELRPLWALDTSLTAPEPLSVTGIDVELPLSIATWLHPLPGDPNRILVAQYTFAYTLSLDDLTYVSAFEYPVLLMLRKDSRPCVTLHAGQPAVVEAAQSVVSIRRFDAEEPLDQFHAALESEILSLATLDDCKLVAAGSKDGLLHTWNQQGHLLASISLGSQVHQVTITDTDTVIARTALGVHAIKVL